MIFWFHVGLGARAYSFPTNPGSNQPSQQRLPLSPQLQSIEAADPPRQVVTVGNIWQAINVLICYLKVLMVWE